MKFSAAAVLAAAAGAHAWSNVTYTTEVVTALTTYCPGPTEITHGATTYTITEVRCAPGCSRGYSGASELGDHVHLDDAGTCGWSHALGDRKYHHSLRLSLAIIEQIS